MSYKHTNPRPKGFDEVISVHWLCVVKDPSSATPDQVPLMSLNEFWMKGKGERVRPFALWMRSEPET